MLQNMMMTTLTPLADMNETYRWENRPFISRWPERQKQETYEYGKCKEVKRTIKKQRRQRTAFTTEQLTQLEIIFSKQSYVDAKTRYEISKLLKIGEKQIKIWFQNRRMKKKRESLDSSSDQESSNASSPGPVSSTEANPNHEVIHQNDNCKKPVYKYDIKIINEQEVNKRIDLKEHTSEQGTEHSYAVSGYQYPTEYCPQILFQNNHQYFNNEQAYSEYYPNYYNNVASYLPPMESGSNWQVHNDFFVN